MTTDDKSARDAQLDELLAEYIEAREAGKNIRREDFLAQHPDFADELREFIALRVDIERVASPLRDADVSHQSDSQVRTANREHAELNHSIVPHQLGEFRLIREIGRGGMGVVYEAEQLSLHRRVALKVLPFAAAIDPRRLQRFKNEALAAANLRHENIVSVYGVGCELGVHYYAMQLIEGQSLSELVSELRLQKQGALETNESGSRHAETRKSGTVVATADSTATPSKMAATHREYSTGSRKYCDWVATLGRKSALALHYAHEVGIIHRDIKPANLMIDLRGEIWITDFGLAQIGGDAGLTVTGEILGTLRYASPEQARALPGLVDQRTDIYSLAATLYELLTLRPLFDGTDRHELLQRIAETDPVPPRHFNSVVPEELETILLKALNKTPTERYSTAEEFAEDLKRYLDDKPIRARRPTRLERAKKWLRRHPSFTIAFVILLALTAVGSLIASAMIHSEQLKVEQAYQREIARADEAEAQYKLARRSVDELFRASEEELVDQPGTEPLRKRLLTSVLSYYREFIEQRPEDERGRADLLEARSRVEKILSDLAALRTSRQLRLLDYDSVLDDLNLDQQQRREVKEMSQRVTEQFKEVIDQLGRKPPMERLRELLAHARQNESIIRTILNREQIQRLYQISLQTDVSDAFRDPEVATTLKLTTEQLECARMIEEEIFVHSLRRAHEEGTEIQSVENQKKPSANRRALAILTEQQLLKWREFTGAPFNFEIPRPPLILPKGE